MKLKTKGNAHLVGNRIVAKVTRLPLEERTGKYALICEKEINPEYLMPYEAVLTTLHVGQILDFPHVHSIAELDHLIEDDIVAINTDGVINTLYRSNSRQNFMLFTERCNSNCLMCSQPPKDRDDSYLLDLYEELIPLIPKSCPEIGITGGEPTLTGKRFFDLLHLLKTELPDTEVHCLTNGRTFAEPAMADKLGELDHGRLMLGIPLYADHNRLHDYIVQAKNAFYETMQGLYNLARNEQQIEIRVVLHKQTIPRLTKLARFIYKNLPFVTHVTFMGLENQGYTPFNKDLLWVDPAEYMEQLGESVQFLADMKMNVSIYNSQLCILPEYLWKYTRRSISDWKNIYLKECEGCSLKERCGGFFASNITMHSKYISALKD